MTTRIKGTESQPVGTGSSQPVARVKRSQSATTGAQTGAQSSDSVQITNTARQLSSLAQAISDAPDVNTSKVESLQQSIGNGTYQVDSGRIADRLMQLEGDVAAAGVKA
ncbi:MAG: flagellar biosynthesis anti-sigma factor FlgM [Steroidobacteraceae bacterium]